MGAIWQGKYIFHCNNDCHLIATHQIGNKHMPQLFKINTLCSSIVADETLNAYSLVHKMTLLVYSVISQESLI